jgi:hypothetical protein
VHDLFGQEWMDVMHGMFLCFGWLVVEVRGMRGEPGR